MQLIKEKFILSPSDLNKYLACKHYINLEKKRLINKKENFFLNDQFFEILSKKGIEHEEKYLSHLKLNFKKITLIPESSSYEERLKLTAQSLSSGIDVIYHPFIMFNDWIAIPDFFIKNSSKNEYIVVDTKLKKSLVPEHIYQSVIYALAAESLFNISIPKGKIISPSNISRTFIEHDFLIYDYARDVRDKMNELEEFVNENNNTRPIPCALCKKCEFISSCEKKLNEDKSLFLLPNITRLQEKRLREVDVINIPSLLKNNIKPSKMTKDTYEKLRLKAELRAHRLNGNEAVFKIIDKNALKMLPKQSENDIFFDIEGDPLIEDGLEYLFGLLIKKKKEYKFLDIWAHNKEQEKDAVFQVIMKLYSHCIKYSKAHIYHYNSYEVNALRRLSQKYNTCENELDELLRGERFIDLYTIVRKLLITSEGSMSLKDLEVFFLEKREGEIKDAGSSIIMYEMWTKTLDKNILKDIKLYNEQDCKSLTLLVEWIDKVVAPNFNSYKESSEVRPFADVKTPTLNTKSNKESLALAISQFHEKEDKPYWWSYFDAKKSTIEDLIIDSSILAGLKLKIKDKNLKENEYKYFYPEQDHKFSIGSKVAVLIPDNKFGFSGEIIFISDKKNEVVLKVSKPDIAKFPLIHLKEPQPPNTINIRQNLEVFFKEVISKKAENLYPASFSLLSHYQSKIKNKEVWAEAILDHKNIGDNNKPLFVQGPPGSGKTYQGAIFLKNIIENKKDTICFITSQSHKAIENILLYTKKITLGANRKILKYGGKPNKYLDHINNYDKLFFLLKETRKKKETLIIGLTVFNISKLRSFNNLSDRKPSDFLIIDEAGQYGLANSVAAAMFTEKIILLGDQNQLPNVTQGSHVMGVENSVMSFCLGNNSIVGSEHGIFLPISRRLHPKICNYISDTYYQSKLKPHPNNKNRLLLAKNNSNQDLSGINLIEIEHEGCAQTSEEEQSAIQRKIVYLIENFHLKISDKILEITYKDFIIVSPYNAQVNLLKSTLASEINVGTVDKFQGQEAPITIISMSSSSIDDAPKGVDFILNENRLNVAISRAQIAVFLFCSKGLFNGIGNSLNQIKLINKFKKIKEYIN